MSGKDGATPSAPVADWTFLDRHRHEAMVTVDTRQSPARLGRSVVAVAVLDGFYGCGSGAGWSNRALIEILAEVLPVDVDLVVLPVRVDAVSSHWGMAP
ncbi:MAG: hypothetical protein ACRDS1_09775 [Pseudonocardiaceae bacterium]